MHFDESTIGGRLTSARLMAGYSMTELSRPADKGGPTVETISNWEHNRRKPMLGPQIRRHCKKLGVRVHWVMTGEGERYR